MRDVIKRSTSLGLALTLYPQKASKEACLFYHIKGMLNLRCWREGDLQTYYPGGNYTLMAWANKVILGEEG